MSAPADQPDRSPLRQQPSAIRIVPYSPPRAAAADTTSGETQQQHGGLGPAFVPARSAQPHGSGTDGNGRANPAASEKTTSGGNGRPHITALSPSAVRLQWARRVDGGVSGGGPATLEGTSSPEPRSGTAAAVTPVSPSQALASLAAVHTPIRGRLSSFGQASAATTSSHLSDADPSSSSRACSPPGSQRRPASRRNKFVAVLNEDKTFSLVPQRSRDPEPQPPPPPPPAPTPTQPQNPPRSSSALSDYSGSGYRSSQLPAFPATPRVSQASSHEGVSSYASSHYDRPSSSLAGTIPEDRSITPATPVPSSPVSSYQETVTEDPAVDSSPWASRMVGGLRRVPNLPDPDAKGKQPAHTPGSDTTETPPAVVPETDTPGHAGGLADNPTQEQQAPLPSRTPSAGSDNTNYKVYRDASETAPDPEPQALEEEEQEAQRSDESVADTHLRPQPSFATAQTASTEFETTNYKVYTHSDDEGSDEALAESPTVAPSSRALRNPFGPPLQSQDSIGSLQSAASSTSENTNYRVHGPSSPVLSPVPESPAPAQDTHELRPAQSFLSAASSLPESANYVVYGRSSPALDSVESLNPPSPSGSNAPLLTSLPPAVPSLYTQAEEEEEAGPSGAAAAEPDYVVLGEPTPQLSREPSPNTESAETVVQGPREEYSQESLVVSPLRPRRPSQEGFGYFTARSRTKSKEDLKTKKSTKSVKSSISSIINEEASQDFFAGQAYLDAPAGEYEATTPTVAGPSERQRQLDEQRERERQQREAAEWEAIRSATGSEGPMALPVTPHQWSSQLSTVQSESEPESSSEARGSVGSVSFPGSHGSHERRSSRGWSSHSRQMLSISSSLAAELEAASRSRSNSGPGSIDRPSPSYRPGYHGTIRDHDEDGDGLAELHQISPRPSRSRLSDLFSNSNSSERNLHSSASMRSFTNTIPLWARVYYGSGERRFLRSTSISSMSEVSSPTDSAVQHSASPTSDHFPLSLYSPRRRPREQAPEGAGRRRSRPASMDIQPIQNEENPELGFRRSLRRMTSSLWSPHLRRDVRARYSIWDTPSVAWSAESGMFGRRNLQVVLFVVGFIFPFAWMIGAVLPLPKPSPLAMVQRDSSYSDLNVRQSHEFERHIETVDELRYENARWWRMLNRCMSVIGLLIIGAVIGLVIAAVKQGWGTRS